jgi:phospholipid N-methyltransferase
MTSMKSGAARTAAVSFLLGFLRDPLAVGAIAPSGEAEAGA